ncbi:MAG TPA: LapD/MoxY N-terminal periplasmic domain-containing protein, partial [Gammaproteobacteria bacterium]|nr:LapD/MoxY N-terminal periplasmic domain-containing protein [Gammaproteobacteria bacterium]
MTLGRQLLISGLIVLLGLFGGMLKFWVQNTQEFLNYQMDVHADNAADAIGISISKSLENNQQEEAKRVVDAYYDSGYYQLIDVKKNDGTPLYQKSRDVYFEGVPRWFTRLLKLQTHQKEKVITSGWMQLGEVRVKGDPSLAYRQVYNTFRDALTWLIIIGFMAGVIGMILLYILLQPLRAITKQAGAICNQEFYELKPLPWTVDLRQVVQAMNNMSNRLQTLFEEHAKTAEKLRQQAFQDPVTNLSNRRYFDLQFSFYLTDVQERTGGVLLLLELKDFKQYNEKRGYAAGDNLLRQTANLVEKNCKELDRAVYSHLGGANFGILFP